MLCTAWHRRFRSRPALFARGCIPAHATLARSPGAAPPQILNLALLVVSYGVSHRLFEFAWKGQLRALYPTPAAYQSVLADVSIATGYCTIALMLLGKFVFQCEWAAAQCSAVRRTMPRGVRLLRAGAVGTG
jgi:hypothetical protein